MKCILTYQQVLPILVLLSLVGLFTAKNKGWVKINKLLFGFLVLSIVIIGGEFLPVWWIFGAQYYDLIYALGLSFLTGFFLYWLTVGREEMKKKIYYSFYCLVFLFDYYELISHFYIRDKYKKILKENEGKNKNFKKINLKIELPSENIFSIIEKSPELTREALNYYEEEKYKLIQKNLKIETLCEVKTCISEDSFLVKIYKKICDKRKIFKSEFSNYLNMESIEEIEKMKFILDYTSDNLNGELDQIEYFLKNHKKIEPEIKLLIKKNIDLLGLEKQYIPGISLKLTSSNFGIIDSNIIYLLINDFYPKESKRYIVFDDDNNRKEYNVVNFFPRDDDYYMSLSNNQPIKLDTIRNIITDKSGVLLF